uniref:Uncharacterized protein n=1 Tax=Syphacia muris TaxID=451379 RepID=A0A0N5AIA2_9BILA
MIFTLTATTSASSSSNRPNGVKPVQERASEGAEGHAAATDGSLLHESSSNTHNTSNRQSVHGVVASLIRAAEKTRFKALDRPQSLQSKRLSSSQRLSSQQDVGTQTSPVSLSRSSSFDWINEPSDPASVDSVLQNFTTLRLSNFASNPYCVYTSNTSSENPSSSAYYSDHMSSTPLRFSENRDLNSSQIMLDECSETVIKHNRIQAIQDKQQSLRQVLELISS